MEAIKEVYLQELEEKYGTDLVKKLQENIDYATKENIEFKIEVVSFDSTYFTDIAIITSAYAYVYEVSLKRKKITSENYIGWRACAEIAKIMKKL
jgi:predicted proteasome-type protease